MEQTIDRNTINGFARRTLKNLDFVLASRRERNADVHEVTQLITALLGLIVFPYEHQKKSPKLARITLATLSSEGWPEWRIEFDNSQSFKNLLRHIRNSISHHRIRFSSDSRLLDEVEITLWDQENPNAPLKWRARINGAHLLDFTRRFAVLLDD